MSDKVAQRTGISVRALAAMALFCAGVWLVPSGIALHYASHEGDTSWSHLFMTMHNTASLIFLIAVVVHVFFELEGSEPLRERKSWRVYAVQKRAVDCGLGCVSACAARGVPFSPPSVGGC
jgi:hypothetical protein